MSKDYNIQYSMYKYAPESFRCRINGKLIEFDDASTLGELVWKGHKAVVDEIKRRIRKWRKERRRVTFGFYGKGNNRYFYTRELGAYDDDLQDKLRIYKLWKEYCLSRDCDLATTIITEGTITPDGESKPKERESSDIVDLGRPIKLRYPYEEVVI